MAAAAGLRLAHWVSRMPPTSSRTGFHLRSRPFSLPRTRTRRRLRAVSDVRRVACAELSGRSGSSSSSGHLQLGATSPQSLEGYMARVAECNTGLDRMAEFLPFVVGTQLVGFVHEEFWDILRGDFPRVFAASSTPLLAQGVPKPAAAAEVASLAAPLLGAPPDFRTAAVQQVLLSLRERGLVPGWRDEFYPVGQSFGSPPAFLVERAAAPLFGVKAYGVHMNGYVRGGPAGGSGGEASSDLWLWVARRSRDKPTFPGKLDHLAAGGQPHNLSCADNMVKECEEEAGIPRHLASRVIPVGAVSYTNISGWAMKRDVLFCYDLHLPPDFSPVNTDGEVEAFSLLPVAEVSRLVRETREYKANCNLVLIDFLFRHGVIHPDLPGYLTLLTSLRQGETS